MPVKEILKYGNPVLLETSFAVTEFDTPELHKLIDDLRVTMQANSGAGLAAPQIGVLKRVVIFGVQHLGAQKNERYPDVEPVPETILINPKIEVLGSDTDGMWEGCLSIPGMRGYVERPNHIRYSGFNEKGQRFEREVSGFHATVVQHECDHLDGVLYPMRMTDLSKLGFIDELDTK